jgi:hypothetical protein
MSSPPESVRDALRWFSFLPSRAPSGETGGNVGENAISGFST